MKQTAVEWLFEQIINRTDRMYFLKELKQAKEMEKEQIINAYDKGYNEYDIYRNGQNYYNETFKSE